MGGKNTVLNHKQKSKAKARAKAIMGNLKSGEQLWLTAGEKTRKGLWRHTLMSASTASMQPSIVLSRNNPRALPGNASLLRSLAVEALASWSIGGDDERVWGERLLAVSVSVRLYPAPWMVLRSMGAPCAATRPAL